MKEIKIGNEVCCKVTGVVEALELNWKNEISVKLRTSNGLLCYVPHNDCEVIENERKIYN